jgi:hypothetical protein
MSFFVGFTFETSSIARCGLDQILDDLELARVNKIMFIAQDPWGSYFTPHDDYYAFTKLKPFKNAATPVDLADGLGLVCEAAEQRGMAVYAHDLPYESSWPGYWPATHDSLDISSKVLKNFTACAQIDLFGRKNFRVCTNHPDYRQYYLSVIEDQLRHYPIEGIKINFERNGPLSMALVGHYPAGFSYRKPMAPVCFCPHCLDQARERGINLDRARQGWLELLEFSETSWRQARKANDPFAGEGSSLGSSRASEPPTDGYFITFLRILMRWPEILQWNQMWYDSLKSLYAELYGLVKLIHPERKLGIHIWHHRAFSIFERAIYDYAEMARFADWIKPKMDHTCAGFRYHQDVRRYVQALFYDREFDRAYEAWNTMLGWEHELPYDQLPEGGMSLDYVKRDTATAIAAVKGEVPIYPGIGIDMPSPKRSSTPETIHDALIAIYEAGAPGVILCRNYAEMKRDHILAAGQAIDEIRADMARRDRTKS